MNRLFKTVAISTAIVTSTLAVPAQAVVIDQIKTKVEAIKNDTATIKSRTNDLQERAEEIAATASAQIIETADIKGALEPLFGLKERFSEMEFDPAELLEAFDIQDLKDVLAELKQQREEVELAMSDPGLEAFRTELLDMLEGINSLFAEDGLVQAILRQLAEEQELVRQDPRLRQLGAQEVKPVQTGQCAIPQPWIAHLAAERHCPLEYGFDVRRGGPAGNG